MYQLPPKLLHIQVHNINAISFTVQYMATWLLCLWFLRAETYHDIRTIDGGDLNTVPI